MQNENRNDEAVSPVIATILMVAITVVLAGVLYVWASSLAEGNTDGNLTLYAFSASDAGASVSTGTDDALVMIAMDQGSDINWAAVSVKLTIDGNAPVTCDNNDQGTSTCYLVEYGTTDDQVWSVGDGVTVYESGQDLCNASCEVVITITDTREGKKIDESTTVAE
jgi:flagellin-like protein